MFTSHFLTLAVLAAGLTSASPTANLTERAVDLIQRGAKATIYDQCTEPKTIALTFADEIKWTSHIVTLLDHHDAKGTFLFNGKYKGHCIYNPDNVRRLKKVHKSGHQIVSHTWSHLHLPGNPKSQVNKELEKIDDALLKIVGIKPAFLALPYSARDDEVLEWVKDNGQDVFDWNFGWDDFAPAESDWDTFVASRPNNAIAFVNEGDWATVYQILPGILKDFKRNGYKFVTVAECLGNKKPYVKTEKPKSRDRSWRC
ncbi:Carbohydrate esterase 4 protein [Tulasnella sp. 403]|nr:Carbohydrate esterase 4 protein [Tulasnella sp. 403]